MKALDAFAADAFFDAQHTANYLEFMTKGLPGNYKESLDLICS